MDLEMVLNELSARTLAPDIFTARQWMSELISTMREAQGCGLKGGLRTQTDFYAMVLAENYPVRRWLNDREVINDKEVINRDDKRFLLRLVTKPFFGNIDDVEIKRKVEDPDCELTLQGSPAEGFKVAYYLETLVISLHSELLWNASHINLELIQIDENRELIQESVEVLHASQKNHVLEHADWIQKRLQPDRLNGRELWNRRDEIFPSLQFCYGGNKQLWKLRTGDEKLKLVLEVLSKFENCAQNWEMGYFNLEGTSLDVSGESEPTLNKYGKERTFLCPDGQERLFEQHAKERKNNWRIHFFPEVSKIGTRKVIIGYVGTHLPTVNDPT